MMALNFLKGEINRKKRKADEITPASNGQAWVTRGELEKEREKKYIEEQLKLEEVRKQKIAKLMEKEDESQHDTDDKNNLSKFAMKLPKEEVIKRLKARREPITYFAETDLQRVERLRKLELSEPFEYTEGSINEFAKNIKEAEAEALEEEAQAQRIEKDDPVFIVETRGSVNIHEKVLFWCRRLLALWQEDLDNRSEEIKRSGTGRRDVATFKQTQSYIRPLLVQLINSLQVNKSGQPNNNDVVPDDIFKNLVRITEACAERDYRKANIAYFDLAIGNAAWPMGVTMVGIHERSAREKISASSVAHVLNDETQRKYISGMKRLVTYHQYKFPTVPSRSVL